MGWQEKTFPKKQTPLIMDKDRSIKFYVRHFMNRTAEIFTWRGLPDTIPAKWLEFYLQWNGHGVFAKCNEKLYFLTGSMGGKLNEYYIPVSYIVSNPYLRLNREFTIGDDCELIGNDALYTGLYPLILRYAELLAECDVTLRTSVIMSRATALITAASASEKQSADEFIRQLEAGKMSIVASNPVFDGVKAQPMQTSARTGITDIIEARQYCLAGLYNEIGLNANFNMKRESINSSETELNRDALFPLIDDMLRERKEASERANAKFGTNISVELSSVWEINRDTLEDGAEPKEGETDVQDV